MWIGVLAVLLLSAPSALGVVAALTPVRGPVAAWLAAVGLELAYLAIATAAIPAALRRHAQATALTAVGAAIILNVVADYARRVPTALSGAATFAATFDPLLLVLAIVESAPLAGLAYALATLLHRLASHPAQEPSGASGGHTAHAAYPVHAPQSAHPAHAPQGPASASAGASAYACPRCGAPLRSQQQHAAAVRYGGCPQCRTGATTHAPSSAASANHRAPTP